MKKAESLRLKARIRAGETVLGAFVFIPSPAVVEILAEAGFDFVILDQEHSPKNYETVENMIRAAEARGISVLVRVNRNEPNAILHALEAGADGVVVPFIRTAADVRDAVSAMHYPPRGTRGLCTQTRTARYGALRTGFADYAAARAEELVLIGLIEDPSGVRNIAEIVGVDQGLDVALIGRGDLAATMGLLGKTHDPQVHNAVVQAIRTTVESGSALGPAQRTRAAMTVFEARECQAWQAVGCSVFVAASEASLFLAAAQSWTAGALASLPEPNPA